MKQLLLHARPHLKRMAIFEDDALVETAYEYEGHEQVMGNIYKGRVDSVLPGMDACFVDIGLAKNAFLHFCDVAGYGEDVAFDAQDRKSPCKPCKAPVRVGDEIVVQVIKESGGEKGVRLSMHLTMPGRRLVLLPGMDDIGISRRISDEQERARLRAIAQRILPEGMGLIMRTAAGGEQEDVLARELSYLIERWQRVQQKSRACSAPVRLFYDGDLVMRTIRDTLDECFDEIWVDDAKVYDCARHMLAAYMKDMVPRLHLWDVSRGRMFCHYSVDDRLSKLLARKIWLKNGAYLIFDFTEALTVIDVNTGKCVGKTRHENTILEVNLAAAVEVARQIRLRDIGGIVIIDFIDMCQSESRQAVLDKLCQELARDRTRTHVGGFTSMGLVELTRKKARPTLASLLERPCTYCRGEGSIESVFAVVMRASRQVDKLMRHTDTERILLEVHPIVAEEILKEAEQGRPLIDILPGRKLLLHPLGCLHQSTVQATAYTDVYAQKHPVALDSCHVLTRPQD
nr:Rne/Rng family ribonuclease [Maliibacterium massiliense]